MADLALLDTLTHLALSGLTLTDAGLAHFANLRGLEELRLQHRAISPVGLAVLRDLPKLRRIEFPECGSQFNDENLRALEGDESLRELVLNKCALTDAAFASLLRIPNLEYANIAETQITAAGLAEFQRQRPNCRIVGKGK
jgi:hypothetical protein